MSLSFSRTTTALGRDRFEGSGGVAIAAGFVLLAGWLAWFLFSQVPAEGVSPAALVLRAVAGADSR